MVCVVLYACPAQSRMVEPLTPLRAKHTTPVPGTQPFHVAIKKAATVCSQAPFKWSVFWKSQRLQWQYSPESLHFKTTWLFSSAAAAESEKSLLKELWHAASKQQEAVLNSVFFHLEFLFKPSQVICGFNCLHGHQSVSGGLLVQPDHPASLALK